MPELLRETLCWSCRRPGTGGCSWDKSKGEVPVEGWTAEPTILRISTGVRRSSYCVLQCPQYVPEDPSRRGTTRRLTREERERMDYAILHGAKASLIAEELGVERSTVYKRKRALLSKEV